MPRKKASKEKAPEINHNPFKSKITIQGKRLTEKQKAFLQLGLDKDTKIMFVEGPAGSTKTYAAVFAALRELQKNDDMDLLYVRTAIESADKDSEHYPEPWKISLTPTWPR